MARDSMRRQLYSFVISLYICPLLQHLITQHLCTEWQVCPNLKNQYHSFVPTKLSGYLEKWLQIKAEFLSLFWEVRCR